MIEQYRQIIASSLAFAMTVSGWLASAITVDREFVEWGEALSVTGFWVLATCFTMGVLMCAVRSLVGMYKSAIAERDARIERLESELREERAKR